MAIFFLFKKNNGAKRSEAILNWIAMSTFELKTHKSGRTYSNPHFFILNKVFFASSVEVLTTKELGQGFVKGFPLFSPLFRMKKRGLKSSENITNQMQNHIKAVEVISKKEKELQNVINKMAALKVAYIRNCFKVMQSNEA